MDYAYDAQGRRSDITAFSANSPATTQVPATHYTYDDASGRITSVSHAGYTATYDWTAPVGGLPGKVSYSGAGVTGTRTPDDAGRLDTISWSPGPNAAPIISNDYGFDERGRRTSSAREDRQDWSYGYNERGEVASGTRGDLHFGYTYDGIGNRVWASVNGIDAADQGTTYDANDLNQYTHIHNPDPTQRVVQGRANAAAVVTATSVAPAASGMPPENLTVQRAADTFTTTAAAAVTDGPAWRKVEIHATRAGVGTGGADVSTARQGWLYFPPKDEHLTYDDDGNLTGDARWTYTWDGENRLSAMEERDIAARPAELPRLRLEFAYDGQSRRVRKVVKSFSAQSQTFVVTSDTRFLYDGWNVIAELSVNPQSAIRNLQSAIGRVLRLGPRPQHHHHRSRRRGRPALRDSALTIHHQQSTTAAPCYDGNGNILAYLNCANGQTLARYEYDPFGRLLVKEESASVAGRLHHQFSTKYTDEEMGLSYYGFRYYSPEMGRWVSRDPIGEKGGPNLLMLVHNSPPARYDVLGMGEKCCVPPASQVSKYQPASQPTYPTGPVSGVSIPSKEIEASAAGNEAAGASGGFEILAQESVQAGTDISMYQAADNCQKQANLYADGICGCCQVLFYQNFFENGNAAALTYGGSRFLPNGSCEKRDNKDAGALGYTGGTQKSVGPDDRLIEQLDGSWTVKGPKVWWTAVSSEFTVCSCTD